MKKNTMMRIASVLLVAVLISTCAISGTFAKYVSTVTGTGTAQVAAWKFTLNDVDKNVAEAANNSFDINLFSTVKDTADPGTAAETDVESGKIAPGMWGYFDIKLTNASEVNATYAINFTVANNLETLVTDNPTLLATLQSGLSNIKFATGTTTDETLPGSMGALGNINATAIAMNTSATVRVFWTWAYETGANADAKNAANEAETALGILAAQGKIPAITVTAAITVTQAD